MVNTTNKNLQRPARGDNPGTWDTPVNADWTNIDAALGKTLAINVTGLAAVTMTSGVTDTYSYIPLILYITGTQSSNMVFTIPSGVGGQWIILNATSDVGSTGPWTVTFRSGGAGTSVITERGKSVPIYSDGTNVAFTDTRTRTASAAGSATQVQYNTGGALDASAGFVYDSSTGYVGIGNTSPAPTTPSAPLTVKGIIYTTYDSGTSGGGIMFPDGSVQTRAAAGTPGSYVATVSFGSTGLTPATATGGAVTVGGTLAVANGGTGSTTSTGTAASAVVLADAPTINTLTMTGTATASTLTATNLGGTNVASTGTMSTTDVLVMNSSFKRNKIINGNMVVNQRYSLASPQAATDGSYYIDRFKTYKVGTGAFTVQQTATAPAGFSRSTLLTITANSTPTSSDYYNYVQAIEGYNIADLSWGTAGAKSVTLSFWSNVSVAGTYSVFITNGTISYLKTFTVTSPGAWERKSVTFAGPTTGTWDATNGGGFFVGFDLGAGTGRTGAASSWLTGVYEHVTGSANWIAGTVGATYYVTGVQLEIGTTATPYEMQTYSDQLSQCQRYYYKGYFLNGFGSDQALFSGTITGLLQTPIPMRTTPTATSNVAGGGKLNFTDTTTTYAQATGGWSIISTSGQAATSQYQSFTWVASTFSSLTSYRPYVQSEYSGMPVDAPAILDAEL